MRRAIGKMITTAYHIYFSLFKKITNTPKISAPPSIIGDRDILRFDSKPITIGNQLHEQFDYYYGNDFELNNSEFYKINDATLLGEHAIVLDKTKKVTLDSLLGHKKVLYKSQPKLFIRPKLDSAIHLEEAFPLVNLYNNNHAANYYHWILDSLLKLQGLMAHIELTGKKPKIIIPKNPKPFQLESLVLLGFEAQDLIEYNGNGLKVKSLYCSSPRRTRLKYEDVFSTSGIMWLQKRLTQNLMETKPNHARIYISRAQANTRRVINEKSITPILERYDFQIVHLENLKFTDQIKLFYNASIVLAPHGAGNTNLIFAKDCTLIELLGNLDFKAYTYSLYYLLTSAVSNGYAYLECETVNLNPKNQTHDLIAPPEALEKTIQKVISNFS